MLQAFDGAIVAITHNKAFADSLHATHVLRVQVMHTHCMMLLSQEAVVRSAFGCWVSFHFRVMSSQAITLLHTRCIHAASLNVLVCSNHLLEAVFASVVLQTCLH